MDEEAKNLYELNYILSPTLSREEIDNFPSKISDLVGKISGELRESKEVRKETLAYEIKKFKQAWHGEIVFEAPGSQITELEKMLGLEKDILRFGIIARKPALLPRKVRRREAPKILKEIRKEPLMAEPKKTLTPKEPKVKLEDIDKKLEEILGM